MVTFDCGNCGHSQQVKDELAGKQVKCPQCGLIGQIPAVPEAKSAAEGEVIKFHCTCGRKIGAKVTSAGKKVRCPQCKRVVEVPSLSADGPQGAEDGKSLMDMLREDQNRPPTAEAVQVRQAVCPMCHAVLPPGEIVCGKCGVDTESGESLGAQNRTNRRSWRSGAGVWWSRWMAAHPDVVKKAIKIIVVIVVLVGAYMLLFGSPDVSLATHKRIQRGMSQSQVKSLFSAGFLNALTKDLWDMLAEEEKIKAQDCLLGRIDDDLVKIRQSAQSSMDMWAKNPQVSRTKTLTLFGEADQSDNTTEKRARRTYLNVVVPPGGRSCSIQVGYEFNQYQFDVTSRKKQCKIIVDGVVDVEEDRIVGDWVSWKGRNERCIAVLFVKGKACCWVYRGPVEDF